MPTAKKQILEVVKKLPAKATWDDIMCEIYLRKQIEADMQAADDGRVVPHKRVKRSCALTHEVQGAMKQCGISEKFILADCERSRS